MLPLVSICIPAYNAERFIAETLASVLSQTYPNIEIIVSDDSSTDRTSEIVKQFESKGVRLIHQRQNLGMCGNWNAVIRCSSGKYVLKLDADDLVDPDHVTEQVVVLEAYPEVVLAHCACRLIDADGRRIGFERSIHGSFVRSGLVEWPRYVCGPRAVNIVTMRRSAFDQVGGYDERYRYSGDWAMHRALLKVGSVFYNDRVLASYRSHSVGKRGVHLQLAQDRLQHLGDMGREWPCEVPGKVELLRRARLTMGLRTARSAAYCEDEERDELLMLLPRFGDDPRLWLVGLLVRFGAAPAVRMYESAWQLGRQAGKRLLYRKSLDVLSF